MWLCAQVYSRADVQRGGQSGSVPVLCSLVQEVSGHEGTKRRRPGGAPNRFPPHRGSLHLWGHARPKPPSPSKSFPWLIQKKHHYTLFFSQHCCLFLLQSPFNHTVHLMFLLVITDNKGFVLKQAVCTDGSLFSHLETIWRFAPGTKDLPDSCKVDFYVSVQDKMIFLICNENIIMVTKMEITQVKKWKWIHEMNKQADNKNKKTIEG